MLHDTCVQHLLWNIILQKVFLMLRSFTSSPSPTFEFALMAISKPQDVRGICQISTFLYDFFLL